MKYTLKLLAFALILLAGFSTAATAQFENEYRLESITTTTQPSTPAGYVAYYLPAFGTTGADWTGNGGKIAFWNVILQTWLFGDPIEHVVYTIDDEDDRKAVWDETNDVFLNVTHTVGNFSQVVYVNNITGDDTIFDGRRWEQPFKTIAAAETAVDALGTSLSPAVIYVQDGHRYIENVDISDNLVLYMPQATLDGRVRLGENSKAMIYQLSSSSGSAADRFPGTSGTARLEVGTAVFRAASEGIHNTASGSTFVVHVDDVTATGTTLDIFRATSSTMHIEVGSVSVEAANQNVFSSQGSSAKITAIVHEAFEGVASSNSTLVDIPSSGCEARVWAFESSLDTLYDLANGAVLRLHSHSGTGTKSVSSTSDVITYDTDEGIPYIGSSFPTVTWDGMVVVNTSEGYETYVYDDSNDLWLGESTFALKGGQVGAADDVYTVAWPETSGFAITYSSTVGWVAPWDCVVTNVSGTLASADTHTFHVRDDGSEVSGTDLTFSETTVETVEVTSFTVIGAGSNLAIYVEDGADAAPAHLISAIIRRAYAGS